MLDQNRVAEILSELGTDYTQRPGHFKCRCFICGDSQKSAKTRRLKISYYQQYNSWMGYCFNGGCSVKGMNIYSLYATVKGVTFSEAKKYIKEDTYNPKLITKALSASPKPAKVEILKHDNVDIEWSDVITETQEVTDRVQQRYQNALCTFLTDRCIPSPYREQVVVAYKGRYQGRVIIPVYHNDTLVYFQGRALFDNIEPKYLNPDVDKELIISNADKFDRDKWIIVTEGLIDSWMVENNQGTSLNGGYFNDRLLDKLFLFTNKGVILAPDNPFVDEAGKKELIRYMKEGKYAGKVKYFIMKGRYKDLNDLRRAKPDWRLYDYIVGASGDKWYTEMRLGLTGW